MSKTLPTPSIASWSIVKVFCVGSGMSALFIFWAWLASGMLNSDWGLSVGDILAGSMFLPLALYGRWAWRPRRKYGNWHRWIQSWLGSWYIAFLPLLGGIIYWNTLLDKPWNLLVNTTSIMLFVLMWMLPAISYALANRLVEIQYSLDSKLLTLGAPAALMTIAGILGANYGLHSSLDVRMLFVAFMFPVLSLGLAQYFAAYLWDYRPWANEDEK